jgi:hypothetical protein
MLGVTHVAKRSLHAALPSFWMGSKPMIVSARPDKWHSQNYVRAWWAALSRVSARSSPVVVVNQAIMPRSEG